MRWPEIFFKAKPKPRPQAAPFVPSPAAVAKIAPPERRSVAVTPPAAPSLETPNPARPAAAKAGADGGPAHALRSNEPALPVRRAPESSRPIAAKVLREPLVGLPASGVLPRLTSRPKLLRPVSPKSEVPWPDPAPTALEPAQAQPLAAATPPASLAPEPSTAKPPATLPDALPFSPLTPPPRSIAARPEEPMPEARDPARPAQAEKPAEETRPAPELPEQPRPELPPAPTTPIVMVRRRRSMTAVARLVLPPKRPTPEVSLPESAAPDSPAPPQPEERAAQNDLLPAPENRGQAPNATLVEISALKAGPLAPEVPVGIAPTQPLAWRDRTNPAAEATPSAIAVSALRAALVEVPAPAREAAVVPPAFEVSVPVGGLNSALRETAGPSPEVTEIFAPVAPLSRSSTPHPASPPEAAPGAKPTSEPPIAGPSAKEGEREGTHLPPPHFLATPLVQPKPDALHLQLAGLPPPSQTASLPLPPVPAEFRAAPLSEGQSPQSEAAFSAPATEADKVPPAPVTPPTKALPTALSAQREKRDFHLINGERIRGALLSETPEALYIHHETLGVLTIASSQLAKRMVEVILINGDRVVGDIVAESADALFIRHASLGMLTVPHAQRSTRVIEAILKDGDRILGEVLAETENYTVIRSAALGTVAVPHEHVALLNRKIEQIHLNSLASPGTPTLESNARQ